MKNIDFAIIGAQKSGTTAIYRYLKEHPQISLPVNKEASYFFSDANNFEDFFNAYYDKKSKFIGSVSPQYMCYRSSIDKIHSHNKDIKLIAILREPIERAYSHHKMNLRRNYYSYDFNEIKTKLLGNSKGCIPFEMNEMDEKEHEINNIFNWGFYGGILNEYIKVFDSTNILIIDYNDLIENPTFVFNKICNHIGADETFIPKNIGKKYHTGGTKTLFPRADFFAKFNILKSAWHILPKKTRERISFWYEVTNVKHDADENNSQVRDSPELLKIFREDLLSCELTKYLAEKWYSEL